MSLNRRQLMRESAALASIFLSNSSMSQSFDFLAEKGVNQGLEDLQRFKLMRSVHDVLELYYKGMTLQFWNQRFEQIDFEKRLINIVHWLDLALRQVKSQYIIDPVWVMSQIMAESLFCELAISPSLAAGICQIMPSTATKSHNMVVAGSLPKHHQRPYLALDRSRALQRYTELLTQKRAYQKANSSQASFNLTRALQWLSEGKDGSQLAQAQIEHNQILLDYDHQIRQAKSDYTAYIKENVHTLGKGDIFEQVDFFVGFDERLTYKKPVLVMVSMLANALRVRQGNMLVAAAAYNAGLSRTWTNEALYTSYGKLPNFSETSQYLSRIVANYEEIAARYWA